MTNTVLSSRSRSASTRGPLGVGGGWYYRAPPGRFDLPARRIALVASVGRAYGRDWPLYCELGSMLVAIAMRLVRLYIAPSSATSHASSTRQPGVEQRLQVSACELARMQRELLGVGADRGPPRIEVGTAPVVGDPFAEHGVPQLLSQRGPVRDKAVQASVCRADDDGDHLPVGRAQPIGRPMQLTKVCEPGAQTLRAECPNAEHVRNESQALPRLREQSLEIGRQVLLVRNRKPRAGVVCALRRLSHSRPVRLASLRPRSVAGSSRLAIRQRPSSAPSPRRGARGGDARVRPGCGRDRRR